MTRIGYHDRISWKIEMAKHGGLLATVYDAHGANKVAEICNQVIFIRQSVLRC
jgi:hypothetical protein